MENLPLFIFFRFSDEKEEILSIYLKIRIKKIKNWGLLV